VLDDAGAVDQEEPIVADLQIVNLEETLHEQILAAFSGNGKLEDGLGRGEKSFALTFK
ncbi:MAG: hypothetical protein IH584_03535, partial [Candidatus Aminicenantes bacterium]|nr:hypothetical protein [Candidatus Aminicenantes bacterium]